MAHRGRPKASSRETLVEAATELFLERGYDATSTSDITTRAGVSRNSFFNYFAAKQDVLWAAFDDAFERFSQDLRKHSSARGPADLDIVDKSCLRFLDHYPLDAIPMGLTQSHAMAATDAVREAGAIRMTRIADAIYPVLDTERPTFERTILSSTTAAHLYLAFAEWCKHPRNISAHTLFLDAAKIGRQHTG